MVLSLLYLNLDVFRMALGVLKQYSLVLYWPEVETGYSILYKHFINPKHILMVLNQPSTRRIGPSFATPSLLLAVVILLRFHINRRFKNVDIPPAKSPMLLL